jgi:acyl dehydratase
VTLFNESIVGRLFEGPSFEVTAEQIAKYAAATNDDSSPAVAAGEVAPPVFAYIALRPVLRAMLVETTPLYLELRGVHGEQDIQHARLVEPGMRLRPTGSVIGIHPRSSGVAVVLEMKTLAEGSDALLNAQYTTIFFPGQTTDRSIGMEAPDHLIPNDVRTREPDARTTIQMDEDQPSRYAAASGDTGQYHLDDRIARERGFNGVIAHGMCTLAFAGHSLVGAVAGGDPTTVRRIAVRFSRPVYPGEELTTFAWTLSGDGSAHAFEMRDPASEVVLAHGRLELFA